MKDEDSEIRIEREEWEKGEFVHIFDPDYAKDKPAATLPAYDAEEAALQILRPKLEELANAWRSGTFADHENGKIFKQAMESCAEDLEELVDDG